MHRIVIINSSTFGRHFPEHLETLHNFAEVDRVDVPADISPDELTPLLKGAHGIIASVTPKFERRTLEQLPELVLLARHGIGCDNVDLAGATEQGILVSRVQGDIEQSAVAEHALALLLSAARHIPSGVTAVRESHWARRAHYIGLELRGKRVGLIGLGNIGRRVAEILTLGFQSQVYAYDPALSAEEIVRRHARPATLEEVIGNSDIISLHCPLTRETARLFNRDRIAQLRRGVLVVNTCRGELFDQDALLEALVSGQIRAYATDVVEGEPVTGDHPLVQLPNVIVVPHLGGYTEESLKGMGETMVQDMVQVFVRGALPGELANPEVLTRHYRTVRGHSHP